MQDPDKLIQQQFGTNADKYATSVVHAQGESLALLLELTTPRQDWVFLDVSTGAGHTALLLAPHVARVIATDLTPQMLTTAERLAAERGIKNIEFKPADAHALPFEDNTFDLVTNRLALHHYSDPRRAIAEMARVCKRGSLLALADNIVSPDKVIAGHINHFEQMRDRSHNWAYPAPRLQAMVADAGMEIVSSKSFSKEMEFGPWADRTGADEETRANLRKWLDDAPQPVQEWLTPRRDGDRLFFMLHEALIIGKKK